MAAKNTWTFKKWIINFKGVDLPIGDLANDISDDTDFPEEDYFGDMLEHIEIKSKNDSTTTETFILAWSYYLSSTRPPFSAGSSTIL